MFKDCCLFESMHNLQRLDTFSTTETSQGAEQTAATLFSVDCSLNDHRLVPTLLKMLSTTLKSSEEILAHLHYISHGLLISFQSYYTDLILRGD